MTDVKIRCDDCKFVENCVDYGWQDCKKFIPTPSEPMTNEEYLRSCNTEQLANVLADVSLWIHPFMKQKNRFELLKKQFYVWLKQPHTDKE